jgi:UDP-glucuronate 4-epimerase
MMCILVTGGAGFIGSHVIDKLLERGDEVICIDSLNSYYSPDIKLQNIAHNTKHPKFHFYPVDIRMKSEVRNIFKKHKISKIIHLAAMAGVRPSIENPRLYTDTNISGTTNLLDLAVKYEISKFVFASSSSVYGNTKETPFTESMNVDNPISPYAATKKAGELLCHTYHHLHGLNINCLRFFTVYGPRGRPDMAIAKFTKAIDEGKPIDVYGDGTSQRDYTFVDDIVSGVIASLDIDCGFEIFNLGNSDTVYLSKLISTIETELGKKANINRLPMQPGDVDITYADISKAQKMLNYNPKTKIDFGIKKYVEWYNNQESTSLR